MLVGNDVSDYQEGIDYATFKNNANFVIAKATEGTTYIDTWFGNNRQQARNVGLPRMFYHFARPDKGNDPIAEAKFFLAVLNGQPLQEGECLALDFEENTDNPVDWAKKWLDYVFQETGVKPYFYSYQSMLTSYDWSPVVNAGYPLWIAAPNGDPNNTSYQTGAWKSAMCHQWGTETVPGISGSVDGDSFFGDVAAFLASGYHVLVPAPNDPPTIPPTQPSTPPQPVPSTPNPAPAPSPQPVPKVSLCSILIGWLQKHCPLQ